MSRFFKGSNDIVKNFLAASQVGASIGLSVFAFATLNLLLSNVNSLQMIIIQNCFEILYPSNVIAFYSLLIPIATFDLLPSSTYTSLLEFEPNPSRISDTLAQMGYETSNAVLNLGSLLIFILIRFLCILLVIMGYPFTPLFGKKLKSVYEHLVRANFFNGILVLLQSSYVELCMSCYLGLVYPTKSVLSGEISSKIISWALLGIGVVLLPLITLSFLFQSEKKLQSSKYETTIGQLYSMNRLTCVFSKAYPLLFCIRRLAAVAVIFLFKDFGSLQIILS